MSFVACCQQIDALKERNAELEGVVAQQIDEIRELHTRLARAEESRDHYRMKANAGGGPW